MGIQGEFGLLGNDSLLVAVERRIHCVAIATADTAFGTIKGFLPCGPSALEG